MTKEIDFFGEFDENQNDMELLYEMAVFRKKTSGLPMDLYLDEEKTYLDGGHGYRIKFRGKDSGDNTRNWIPLTISDNPEIPKKYVNIKHGYGEKDITLLKEWVKKHKKKLIRLSDSKIEINEFYDYITIQNLELACHEFRKLLSVKLSLDIELAKLRKTDKWKNLDTIEKEHERRKFDLQKNKIKDKIEKLDSKLNKKFKRYEKEKLEFYNQIKIDVYSESLRFGVNYITSSLYEKWKTILLNCKDKKKKNTNWRLK